jgi:lipid-binding SYLF domain-containing protein
MFKHISARAALLAFTFLFATASAAPLIAQTTTNASADLGEYSERANNAASVLGEIMRIPEEGIPAELMSRARAVAVIPHVVKAAFGIGGRYGKGLVSQRMPNGKWSTPAFVEIEGGSFGLQLGVEATDLVLVFTNDEGLRSLMKGKVKLGADATVAAGPVGRKAEVGTDVLLNSAIYSYSRSKGLFAGVSLDGAAITMDDSANAKVYGKPVDGEAILLERDVQITSVGKPFIEALERVSPKVTAQK